MDNETIYKKPARAYSKTLRTQYKQEDVVDRVHQVKDAMLKTFDRSAKGLTNNQCIVLARELAEAFNIMAQYTSASD
jgi:hypothetical protein